jgi:glycosyltransferase involved in cell wall biosynthesis
MDVRDLWPAAAVALGELSSPHALRAAERLEAYLYRSASAIIAVTRPFVEHIAAVVPEARIELVPNGTTDFWIRAGQLPGDKTQAALPPNRFVWAFAGNVGLAQGLDAAVDAAAALGEGYQLLVLGDGAAKGQLRQRTAGLPSGRVAFRDQVPQEDAAAVLRACDALLVSLAPDPALAAFVPSKLFDFCALGRPVILAAAGESCRMLDQAAAGVIVEPGNPQQLANAVRQLRADHALREGLSAAGRRFAERNLRTRYVEKLEATLSGAALRRRRRSST